MQGLLLAEGETKEGTRSYIMQYFHKFVVSLFCIISPPMWATLCKLLVETLKVLFGDINITVRVCTLLFQVVRVYVALLSPWVGFLYVLER